MNSVVIIAPQSNSVQRFVDIARTKWKVSDENDVHCLIENEAMHVIINTDDNIKNDYDLEEMALILRRISDPKFFIFEFNDFQYGKEVLAELVNSEDLLIDDDHGNVMSGKAFSSYLRKNPNFDWRKF